MSLDARVPDGSPFGIYLHVPFCVRRCGYCAFVTYAPDELSAAQTHQRWADAAAAELDLASTTLARSSNGVVPEVTTVYFGGGTPSAVAPALLARLLDVVRNRFDTADDLERVRREFDRV